MAQIPVLTTVDDGRIHIFLFLGRGFFACLDKEKKMDPLKKKKKAAALSSLSKNQRIVRSPYKYRTVANVACSFVDPIYMTIL